MGNLRMLGIASALLLLVPFGYAAQPWTVFDTYNEVYAAVSDLEVLNLPDKKVYDPNSFFAEEQPVEGHTVFATIELRANTSEVEGNVTIAGVIDCRHDVEYDYEIFPIPSRVRRAEVGCVIGERVVVYPVNYTSNSGQSSDFTPTGRVIPFTPPSGVPVYAEEFSFLLTETNNDGLVVERTMFAWATPVVPPWTTDAGKVKNFMMPIPLDRILEMDCGDYQVVLERDLQ
jgi:hypothetical protein